MQFQLSAQMKRSGFAMEYTIFIKHTITSFKTHPVMWNVHVNIASDSTQFDLGGSANHIVMSQNSSSYSWLRYNSPCVTNVGWFLTRIVFDTDNSHLASPDEGSGPDKWLGNLPMGETLKGEGKVFLCD